MAATLTIITGPMFSGKSEELIRLLHRANYAKRKILCIKPAMDKRSGNEIRARKIKAGVDSGDTRFPAHSVASEKELTELGIFENDHYDLLAVDEAQFFDNWLINFVQKLLEIKKDRNFQILIAGLDMDAWRKPFGPVPALMAMADEVKKETAICFACHGKNGSAIFTQKIGGSEKRVEIGTVDIYEARCRVCHIIPT